jgi:hypothetical protein
MRTAHFRKRNMPACKMMNSFYPNLGSGRGGMFYFLVCSPCLYCQYNPQSYCIDKPPTSRCKSSSHDALAASSALLAREDLESSGDADVDGGEPIVASGPPSISARILV